MECDQSTRWTIACTWRNPNKWSIFAFASRCITHATIACFIWTCRAYWTIAWIHLIATTFQTWTYQSNLNTTHTTSCLTCCLITTNQSPYPNGQSSGSKPQIAFTFWYLEYLIYKYNCIGCITFHHWFAMLWNFILIHIML